MGKFFVCDSADNKYLRSKDYNFNFDKETGLFFRWGEYPESDPFFSPVGPELLDVEVSTICNHGCPWCYKGNTHEGKNMSLGTFKKVLTKVPKHALTQIAFGIGDIDSNPELFDTMQYTRELGIIPNITINGTRLRGEILKKLANTCGAVAVSCYDMSNTSATISRLAETARGQANATLRQINIHQLLSEETYTRCWNLISAIAEEPSRWEDLNAVVFLLMKPKGPRNQFRTLKSSYSYRDLVYHALEHKVRFGFDSCTAPSFLRAVANHPSIEQFKSVAEPCESTLFSLYIDVEGKAWPCSFCAGEKGYEGIDLLQLKNENDFLKNVWHNQLVPFRKLLELSENKHGCRQCPVFDIEIDQCE